MAGMDWVLLGVSIALMLTCGVFGAAEYSLVTVDRAAVERAVAEGDRSAAGVRIALKTLSTQLSGAQVGVTVTNLIIGFLAEPAIAQLIDGPLESTGIPEAWVPGIAVAIGLTLATIATMLFGELVPKKIALASPLATARATQRFQRGFTTAMKLPIKVLNGSANAVVRALGIEPQEELRSARSADELASLAGARRRRARSTARPPTWSSGRSPSARVRRREIMTPRVRMACVDTGDPVSEVIELRPATGYSKFPVIKGSTDHIVGSVHVKQAVAVPAPSARRRRCARSWSTPPSCPSRCVSIRSCNSCGPRGSSWRSSPTSTAARPAWSRSRTWSRRSWATSPTSTTATAPGCGSVRTAAGSCPGCSGPTRCATRPGWHCPSTRTTTPLPVCWCGRSAGSPSGVTRPTCRCRS